MHSEFLDATVFHMIKPVGGCSHLSDEQIKLWPLHKTFQPQIHYIIINVAVYTIAKDNITILHNSVQPTL